MEDKKHLEMEKEVARPKTSIANHVAAKRQESLRRSDSRPRTREVSIGGMRHSVQIEANRDIESELSMSIKTGQTQIQNVPRRSTGSLK